MSSPPTKTIVDYLWRSTAGQSDASIYAIVDAARQEKIYPTLFNSGNEYYCLYRGSKAKELAYVAPYLVALSKDDGFTQWLIGNGWGDSRGIFAASSASLRDLRQHFRKFLTVHDEDGKALLFRYYDPRVLRVYLPTCNASELKLLFGPVERYALEGENGEAIVEYTCVNDALVENTFQVALQAR